VIQPSKYEPSSEQVHASCQNTLHEVMFWDMCSGLRHELFASCLDNLTAHTSPLPAILMMDSFQTHVVGGTLPYLTLSYPTLPYPTLPYPTLNPTP